MCIKLVSDDFYTDLRTKQQLGYIVFCGVRVREGRRYLTFTVQSNVVDSGATLLALIEKFVEKDIPSILGQMSDSRFSQFRDGIITRKLGAIYSFINHSLTILFFINPSVEPDQRLTSQAGRFWSEISNEGVTSVLFDRGQVEVRELQTITRQQMIAFSQSLLLGQDRRLLVVQIDSQVPTDAPKTAAINSPGLQIDDLPAGLELDFVNKHLPVDLRDKQ